MQPKSDTIWLEAQAKEIGFDLCGVVAAERFPELARTEDWLARGFAGEMKYLADPRRTDAARVMPGIRSIIVCGLNYNAPFPRSTEVVGARDSRARPPLEPQNPQDDSPRGWISRYAWGSDYHEVLRERLEELAEAMRHRFRDEAFDARVYSDTGPIQERVFAKYAGLGWQGKNTLLLNQRLGSLFFLGAILTTLELAPTLDEGALPPPDLCGSCRKCLDACPTDAFPEPYVMDARRCIAYLTIELRGSIPEEFREPIGSHVFGCDICQDVCPWNRRAPSTLLEQFQPRRFAAQRIDTPQTEQAEEAIQQRSAPDEANAVTSNEESLFMPRLEWLASMTEDEFRNRFRGSAVKRAKWRGLIRNACIALGNANMRRGSEERERILPLLEHLSASEDAAIAESALWALRRIE